MSTGSDPQLFPAEAHRVSLVVAFAITPAGLASYAKAHGFGTTPADHAKALEHLTTQLPHYVDTGLYRSEDLAPCVWHVTTAAAYTRPEGT